MQATSPDIPVLVIQSMWSDLWATKTVPGLSICIIDEINPDAFKSIIQKQVTKNSVIILEKEAFEGCGSPMRGFIRQVRISHGQSPRILVLRCKSTGQDNPALTEGDKAAGANAVLWYQLSMSTDDLTKDVHHFIRNLPITNFGKQETAPPIKKQQPQVRTPKTTPPRKQPSLQKRTVGPKQLPTPASSSWLEWPFGESKNNKAPTAVIPTSVKSATTIKEVKNRRAEVTLYGVTIAFRKSIAETLLFLANEPTKIGQRELMRKLGLATTQPVYDRIGKLKESLETYAPGLGRCIVRTEIANERNQPIPQYRFDHDIWCTVLGIK